MKFLAILFSFSFLGSSLSQQNLTIEQAEELFQKNNLQLLANQYNVSNAKAAEIQSKIWDLPYVSGELNLINPQNNSFFDVGHKGQKAVAIQQLIYLGGKKRKEVEFAKSNTLLAELYFEQLIKNLKLQLNQNFYALYFENIKLKSLTNQIAKIEKLVDFYNIQATKGNVPLKDVVRLQSLLLNLKNDFNSFSFQVLELQRNLKLLTGTEKIYIPTTDENSFKKFDKLLLKKDSILSLAIANNIDLKIAKQITENYSLQLNWQKSLATPDLTLGLSYDQRGGAFGNQVNLTFGMPLRIKNKNKGNIKIAENEISASKINVDIQRNQLISQLQNSVLLWEEYTNQLQEFEAKDFKDMELVNKGVIENFERKNISLIEFSDFMESYNLSTIQINEVKKNRILTALEMNYLVNNILFN